MVGPPPSQQWPLFVELTIIRIISARNHEFQKRYHTFSNLRERRGMRKAVPSKATTSATSRAAALSAPSKGPTTAKAVDKQGKVSRSVIGLVVRESLNKVKRTHLSRISRLVPAPAPAPAPVPVPVPVPVHPFSNSLLFLYAFFPLPRPQTSD